MTISSRIADSFFTTTDGEWFQPTPHTRGPWDVNACHAGPPTALLARALEREAPDFRLSRLTVNLLRPVPYSGFRIESSTTRQGRSVTTTEAQLIDSDGKVRVTATGLHLMEQSPIDFANTHIDKGSPEDASPGEFPILETLHGEPAFNGDGIEIRYPAGENREPGPTTAWMCTVPLFVDEVPSPFQRICPLADCGNAFGRNADPKEVTFVNADLTIVLFRDPVGEWLGTSSVGHWQPNGIGLADALLFDEHGAVGRALQTLVLREN
ncbi:MAG: thioesterase family protein [Granulosicoccus sp.]